MTEHDRVEHDRLYAQATKIAMGEIEVHDRKVRPWIFLLTKIKLKRALRLFGRVLEINPGNWPAMWMSGKIEQRSGNFRSALTWFNRAYQLNPSHPDVAREASLCAMNIGAHDDAIAFAHRAVQIESDNPGLHANLALAYLLSGQTPQAQAAIERALAGDPVDKISQLIQSTIHHFAGNGQKPPPSTPQLMRYRQKHRLN